MNYYPYKKRGKNKMSAFGNVITEWFMREMKPREEEITQPIITNLDSNLTQFATELPLGFYSSIYSTNTFNQGKEEQNVNYWLPTYRIFEMIPEVDDAISEIVNEAIVPDTDGTILKLNLSKIEDKDVSPKIKDEIQEKFNKILGLLKFDKQAVMLFKRWYVDGRIFFNVVVDKNRPKQGIQKLLYVDPISMKLIKEDKVNIKKAQKEFTIYTNGIEPKLYYEYTNLPTNQAWKVSYDLVIYCGSDFYDRSAGLEVSYLHKAIKAINNLRNIEDSVVIYRLVRATEKRLFKVATGQLPKQKAEEYTRRLMNQFKNRLNYNAVTGAVSNDKNTINICEDFWFPTDANGKGTTIDLLSGGQTLGQLDDLYYFVSKVWRALGVPESRRELDKQKSMFGGVRNGEIERDEIKFFKFIQRLRNQFTCIFTEALKRELIYCNIMGEKDFEKIRDNIHYNFTNDNSYSEIKDLDLMDRRIETIRNMQDLRNIYFTDADFIKILGMTEEEFEKKKKEIEKAKEELSKQKLNPDGTPKETMTPALGSGDETDTANFGNKQLPPGDEEEKTGEEEEK